jgi:amino acid adenylation domain-containing protein
MVTAQAARAPEAIAVTSGSKALTYGELDLWATSIARYLNSLGVGPDMLIGICLDRSIEMLAAALGVLKAGGAYVPLDPAYPCERLQFILRDAEPVVVLTNGGAATLRPGKWKTVIIGDIGMEGRSSAEEAFSPPASLDDLAYVIYTSGSTGTPKGVEITHRGLSNLVSWHRVAFDVRPTDRASHLASVGFDAAVWEIWPYLCAGASVHVTGDSERSDPARLRDWLTEQQITISFIPTALTERIISLEWPAATALRYLLTGADTLQHYAPPGLPFTLVNNYGPTECTVVATAGAVAVAQNGDLLPPIGRPIANTEVYILRDRSEQVPPGEPGEICISGPGVARGYHNRPDLTAQKFIQHPFQPDSGRRVYCTGDRGRYLPDGQIAFLGRTDDQIKIRGYRIEPAEITAALNAHPAIRESAVIAREDASGEKRLIAYLVSNAGAQIRSSDVREFLQMRLPEYMIPAIFVSLDALPANANGKVDRASLPGPTDANTLRGESRPASPAVEATVSRLVTRLVGLPQVGPHDNFFLLGGHSLLAAQLAAGLRKALSVELPLHSIFRYPTVAELSAEVERLKSK